MGTSEQTVENLLTEAARLQKHLRNGPTYAAVYGGDWSAKHEAETRSRLAAVEAELKAAERASTPFWLRWLR